tara:strand:+ start:775 stop:1110 length:336 start_codon:yes stop_codon:yes gene_type:complete
MKNTYETTKTINLAPESKTIRKFLDEKLEDRNFTIRRLSKIRNISLQEATELFDELHRGYEELWEMGFKRKVEVEVDMDNDYKATRIYGNAGKAWRKSMGYGGTSFDEEQA